MRRENYEFQVSRPNVIMKKIDGVQCEPIEFLIIEVPENYVGAVMEKLGSRKAELVNMGTVNRVSLILSLKYPQGDLWATAVNL